MGEHAIRGRNDPFPTGGARNGLFDAASHAPTRSWDVPPAILEAGGEVEHRGSGLAIELTLQLNRRDRGHGDKIQQVDGKVVATKRMQKTLPVILQRDESFDIGSDTLTGVNDADYKPPFPLTAKLNKLTIRVDRPQLSPADIKKLEAAMTEKAKRD